MTDWSLLQPVPNFAAMALGGYQAGQALGRQKRFDAALGNLDLSRPETVMPLIAADPERGTPIFNAALRIADVKRETDAHAAFGDAVAAMYGQPALRGGRPAPLTPGATPPSIASPAGPSGETEPRDGLPGAPIPEAGASASDPSNPDIVVTARMPSSADPRQEAMIRLAYKNPEAYKSIVDVSSKLDEAKLKIVADSQDALATAAMIARRLPYEQRRARIQAMVPWLTQHHVTEDQIGSFDPTDDNLDNLHDEALGVKGITEEANKDRAFKIEQARLDETKRHNHADEATAATNAATSRGQLGVAKGRLALAGKVAGGGGVSSASTADLIAMARGQKGLPAPSASDIFAIAGDQ